MTDLNTILDQIKTLPGVTGARTWDRVPGKERIYVETQKCNGGRTWNGGNGYSELYIDLSSKQLIARCVAGAATRKFLAPTIEALTQIAIAI